MCIKILEYGGKLNSFLFSRSKDRFKQFIYGFTGPTGPYGLYGPGLRDLTGYGPYGPPTGLRALRALRALTRIWTILWHCWCVLDPFPVMFSGFHAFFFWRGGMNLKWFLFLFSNLKAKKTKKNSSVEPCCCQRSLHYEARQELRNKSPKKYMPSVSHQG